MKCAACDLSFRKWSKFRAHCIGVHGANSVKLERAGLARYWTLLVLVVTDSGRPLLMVQDPLWPEDASDWRAAGHQLA